MCNECEKTKATTPDKVHVVELSPALGDFLKKKNIEAVVKENGFLIIETINTDYDKDGNFIGDYSDLHEIAKPFIQKYNPQRLNIDEYKELYYQNKLPWQQEQK